MRKIEKYTYLRSSKEMKTLWPLLAAMQICLSVNLYSQPSTSQNYVIANTVKQAGIISEPMVNTLPVSTQGRGQTVTYFDGLGRPLQNIITQWSPSQKDIVFGIEYDQFGREIKKYLPYSDLGNTMSSGGYRTTWKTDQSNFYNGLLQGVDADAAPFSQSVPESSPLNRMLGQGAPGTAWQPNPANPYDATKHSLQSQYLVCASIDNVRLFNVDSAGNISTPGFYTAGQLTLRITTDEQGQSIKEYTDNSNHIILKRVLISNDSLQTYYLYDNLGMLRGVIQPEGVAQLIQNNWVFPSNFAGKWMFLYRYDQRNRIVMKKVPGADSALIVYDQWDRVVLTQDGNLRILNSGSWLFSKYDQLNRPIMTGIIIDSRAQSLVRTDVANATGRFETVNSSVSQGYTLNNSFPSSSSYTLTINAITYYDSYANLPSWSGSYAFVNEYGIVPQNVFLQGQVIGTQNLILGTSNYIHTVTYYDDKYRVIQVSTDNADGGTDRITRILSFDGKITNYYHSHTSRFFTTPIVIQQVYSYDPADRLLQITHQTASQEVVTLQQNSYNEVGQLLNKKIHQSPSHPNYLQKLDYTYNIRGWLNSINKPMPNEAGYDESDLFNLELHYNAVLFTSPSTPEFNSNISEEIWKSGYDEYVRGYSFGYDKANRILSSTYAWGPPTGGTISFNFTKKYNEDNITYDHNGNLQLLNRFHGDWNEINGLNYKSYNGNQLGDVQDWSGSTSGIGFQDKENSSHIDYTYDANGNLTSDYNKSITSITYNFLNLPILVTITSKGTISYTYDALGHKLQKTISDQTVTPNKITNYYYAGDFVYRNDTLEFIDHPEGRLRPTRIDTTKAISISNLKYIYDYFMKDHLGSTRALLTTEQETDVYAATMEAANATTENQLFSNISSTTVAKPGGFDTDNTNAQVAQLNGNVNITTNKRVGPSIVLKVMVGDTVSISSYAWYTGATQGPATGVTPIANDILPLLTGGVISDNGTKGGAISSTSINGWLSTALNSFLTNNQPYDATRPKAFLNWMIVDEEFNAVSSPNHLGAVQIPLITGSTQKQQLVGPANMVVRRNGWLYVYVSNESNQNVYFDNLIINQKRGPMLEQKDYYPFGLEIPGLSTQAFKPNYNQNRYKYNGKEYDTAFAWDTYDYGAREYDPASGRWGTIDPLTDLSRRWSPYSFAYNNPQRFIDADGMSPVSNNDTWGNFNQIANGTLGSSNDYEARINLDNNDDHGKTTTDAGHGDRNSKNKVVDPGAEATDDNTQEEKDYALLIEEATNMWLTAFGINNTRTRTGDADARPSGPLQWRDDIATNNNSEVFISFHLDQARNTKNLKVIYQQGNVNEDISKYLGNLILASLSKTGAYDKYVLSDVKSLNRKDASGNRETHLHVINKFNTGGPGLLIEFGSISSPSNREYIRNHSNELGRAIAVGVYQYFNNGKLPIIKPF